MDDREVLFQEYNNLWNEKLVHKQSIRKFQDWYGKYTANVTDPKGPNSRVGRVLRGGSWYSPARNMRSAYCSGNGPDFRNHNFGFRLARDT